MFQGLSENSNRIINNLALIEMQRFQHKVVQPEHILIALLKDAGEKVFAMLDEIIDMVHFQCILESHMDKISDEEAISSKNILVYYNVLIEPAISQRTKKIILQAIDEARNYNQNILDTFSLFLACCADEQSIANVILMRHHLALDDFRKHYHKFLKEKRNEVQEDSPNKQIASDAEDAYTSTSQEKSDSDEFTLSLNKSKVSSQDNEQQYSKQTIEKVSGYQSKKTDELQKYCIDLTKKFYEDKTYIIHGRDEEIEKVFRVLLRKQKNNPLLVGDAGVGKTAIVEELARRIAIGDAPLPLLDSRILELNLTSLTAGTRYRGDFEERLMNIVNEVVQQSKKRKIFLFIDEFHHIVGTGLASGLTMDAAGILKPALARGTISCIGATTFEEYRKHIEVDKAFQRRLQLIEIQEMSQQATVLALQQIKNVYEEKHNVRFSSDAIHEIVKLSSNYFFDRKLPDKAIDLLDEIGSYTSLNKVQAPKELKELIKEENSLISTIRKTQKHNKVQQKDNQQENKETNDSIADSSDTGSDDYTLNIDKFYATTQKRRELQKKLIHAFTYKQTRINPKIVREIVSKITGINQENLQSKNITLLNNFEERLKQTIIGQDEAIQAVTASVSRGILGLRSSRQPMGSFIFLGPSGVGKTFTARQLAQQLYGVEEALTRFDMGDYSESNSINRLIGSPPGYVGYEESGILIKSVRRRPHQVLLFDEIEKAHPRIYDIFLQILEEGTLQGQRGEYADFRHSIIIFTSNVGSKEILQSQLVGFSDKTIDNKNVEILAMQEVKKLFRPELINRFNDIVVFNLLQKEQVQIIIRTMLHALETDLKKHKIEVQIEKSVEQLLLNKYYQKEYGARSIAKGIREIEDCVASSILKAEIKEGSNIMLGIRDNDTFHISQYDKRVTKKATKFLSTSSTTKKYNKNLVYQ